MNFKYILSIALLAILFISCEKDESTPEEETVYYESIVTNDSAEGKFTVELKAYEALSEGYNKLFFSITEKSTGKKVTEAQLDLMPKMHMEEMTHAAPKENPTSTANTDNLFEGAVVFIMPSTATEDWSLELGVETSTASDMVVLNLPKVVSQTDARLLRVVEPESEITYFISLLEPQEPTVGLNNIEFTVHYRENMMSFPAAEDLSLTFEPEMPSMGHGSPQNEMPVHMTNGHYSGKVNFTMTGWWRLNLTVKKGDTMLSDDTSFDVNF